MIHLRQIAVFLLFIVFQTPKSFSQSNIITGSDDEIIFRDLVLKNDVKSNTSFTVRPSMHSIQDTSLVKGGYFFSIPSLKHFSKNNQIGIRLLPLVYESQYNHQAFGSRNNGSFLSVRGYQQKLNTGIEITSSILDLRLNPEMLWSNLSQQNAGNNIHYFGGQSMVRLKAGKMLALSAGTESLWWGPAVFNSLMMSNNAPGFPHISLHTYQPIKLPIGIIEFNLVGGHLKNNRDFPMENFSLIPMYSLLPGRETYKRYFSGLNFAFQPIFMPDFTVGINRMLQYYTFDQDKQGGFLQTFLPVLTSIFKSKTGGNNGLDEDAKNRDQLINFFARYFFKEYHLEVYGEFGWNDHKYNLRDLASNPDHSAAYNIGLRKVIPSRGNKFFTIETEITQMAPTNSEIARGAGNWYVHGRVLEGYTNYGQIIGGGIAPGDNTATLRFSRTDANYKQQVYIERYQHNPQFNAIKWTDWSMGFKHLQYWKSMTIGGGIDAYKRKNYQHQSGKMLNLMPTIKIMYHWK